MIVCKECGECFNYYSQGLRNTDCQDIEDHAQKTGHKEYEVRE